MASARTDGVSPDRWRRIETLYAASVHKAPAERAVFLVASCGDDEDLRSEVESLLAANDSDPEFMETSFMNVAAGRLAAAYAAATDVHRVGPYQLRGPLGAGGMGQVYRAWDPRLERELALKMFRADGCGDVDGRERLVREARVAACLSHPNICTVFEVGEADGQAFIAMELVEGNTLAEMVRGQRIDRSVVIGAAVQIAAALDHAHQRGVLHRDLKAANILLTRDGTVKVLDFGLAKRLDQQGIELLSRGKTRVHASVRGTLAYMAPELLRGELADVRSDLWSFGVTLFEMVTGELPFDGNTDLELASAILSNPPRAAPANIEPGMGRIIERCLAKDASQRFQSAAQLRQALVAHQKDTSRGSGRARRIGADRAPRGWRSRRSLFTSIAALMLLLSALLVWQHLELATGPRERSLAIEPVARAQVAVLPTRLIGAASEEPHLSIVIPDMITTRLAASSGLRVRPTAAVLAYENTSLDVNAVGRVLQVDNLLISTLWRSAGQYRLNLQLVNNTDSLVVWAQEFTLSLEDLPRIEIAIVAHVAKTLRSPVEQPLSVRRVPLDLSAYDEYLKGRAMLMRHSPQPLKNAVAAFSHVLEANPDFAPAHAGLALASARLYWQAGRADLEGWAERAKAAAQRALSLDPSLADAHLAIAAIYRYNESDWIGTIEESRLALDLDPSLDLPHHNLAVAFYHLGLFDVARRASLAGVTANPATRFESLFNRGRIALYAGAYADAESMLEEAARFEGGERPWVLGEAYFYNGHLDRAEALLKTMFEGGGAVNRVRAGASLASILASRGRRSEARQILERTLSLQPTDHHASYRVGTAFGQLHDSASAVRWLRRAAESGFPCYAWFATDPLTEPLKHDEAFGALLRELRSSAARWNVQYSSLYRAR